MIAVKSPLICSNGAAVGWKCNPSSLAMILASVVLPSPGGPYSKT